MKYFSESNYSTIQEYIEFYPHEALSHAEQFSDDSDEETTWVPVRTPKEKSDHLSWSQHRLSSCENLLNTESNTQPSWPKGAVDRYPVNPILLKSSIIGKEPETIKRSSSFSGIVKKASPLRKNSRTISETQQIASMERKSAIEKDSSVKSMNQLYNLAIKGEETKKVSV